MNSYCHRMLILYTGGTIGMVESANGLTPASGFENYIMQCINGYPSLSNIQWQLQELHPLIDSANMNAQYWQQLIHNILQAVATQRYDSILILHGTDTLVYTAATLAFTLLGLDIPIVLTGSMLPAGMDNSDAEKNLCGAMQALASGKVSGLQIYFHGQLLSAVRAIKFKSQGDSAFVGVKAINPILLSAVPENLNYQYHAQFPTVVVLPIYPAMPLTLLQSLLDNTAIKGLILECYGSGTIPSEDDAFISVLSELINKGVIVVAISQCIEGNVDFLGYEAASILKRLGVINGLNMTRAATLAKLTRLIGLGLSVDQITLYFQQNFCGELG